MPNHPLAEVFGFPADNLSPDAQRVRANRLCPYNNTSPNCTKTSVENPLGVCSVFSSRGDVVITCPVRFRQNWRIATDAAEFFFPPGAAWTALTEMQLNDPAGKSAGSIDVVLVSYDKVGRVLDYGALEVQAVTISGNVRTPFEYYMEDPATRFDMDWRGQHKTAVALNRGCYDKLPTLEEVDRKKADIAWLIYDLQHDTAQNRYALSRHKTVYTKYSPSWRHKTKIQHGEDGDFVAALQARLDKGGIE